MSLYSLPAAEFFEQSDTKHRTCGPGHPYNQPHRKASSRNYQYTDYS